MPTDMQLIGIFQALAGINPEALAKRTALGAINFEASLSALRQMKTFFVDALTLDWGVVPSQIVDSIKAEAQALWAQVSQMGDFQIANQVSPQQTRDAIQTNVLKLWGKCYAYSAPHVAYLKAKSASPDLQSFVTGVQQQAVVVEKQLQEQATAVNKSLAVLNKQAEDDRQKVHAVLKSVTDAAKDVGVTQEAKEFSTLSQKYFRGAVYWLSAAIVLGLVTFYYAGLILHDISPLRSNQLDDAQSVPKTQASTNGTNGTNSPVVHAPVPLGSTEGEASPSVFLFIRTLVPRLIRVTLLLTAFVFCLKNFSALSHNYIVNRHRATALSTFQTFVTGSRDEQVRNAILLQASQSIFSAQPSGFLKGDSDSPQVTPVYEIAKTLVSKEKD